MCVHWGKATEEPDFISDLHKQKYLIHCSELWNSLSRRKERYHLVIKHHTAMLVPAGRVKVPLWHVLSLWDSLTLYSKSGLSRHILTKPSTQRKQGWRRFLSHTGLAHPRFVQPQVCLRVLQHCQSSLVLMQCNGKTQPFLTRCTCS